MKAPNGERPEVLEPQASGQATVHGGNDGGANLICRGINKAYLRPGGDALVALEDVDLRIESGEFVTILGPSGCGKSTLLNIMAGLDSASTGTVTVQMPAAGGSDGSRRGDEVRCGYVFQRDTVLPWANVQQNVELGTLALSIPKAERRERVGHWLAAVGLQDFASALPSQLSGGMRKRVALATAFVSDPAVLFMDEPFAALDAQTRLRLQAHVLELCSTGKRTVVFVTHDIDEAILLSDRIVVMSARPGRISAEYQVDIPRPRRIDEVRTDRRYLDLVANLWNDLKHDHEDDHEDERD